MKKRIVKKIDNSKRNFLTGSVTLEQLAKITLIKTMYK